MEFMMKKFGKAIKNLIPDALAISGALGIAYGMSLIFLPLGYIVGGILLILGAWIWSKS